MYRLLLIEWPLQSDSMMKGFATEPLNMLVISFRQLISCYSLPNFFSASLNLEIESA